MKLKIFKAGNYPQGNFLDVGKLIEGVKSIPGIIYHTSHHLANGLMENDIPVLGEFSNFVVKGSELFADFMFNDKGMEYFEKDKIKNISVEIDNATGKLAKVGLLPPGVKPQISGLSSFEQSKYTVIEFEIEGGSKVTKEELIAALLAMSDADRKEALEALLKAGTIDTKLAAVKAVKDSITADERAAARVIAYEFSEAVKEPEKPKTEAEIREEIKKEFEAKEQVAKAEAEKTKAMAEFEEILKKKVVPAHHEAYKLAYKATYSGNAEFAEQRENIKKLVTEMPENVLLKEFSVNQEDKESKDGFQKGVEIVKQFKGGN